MQRELIGQEAKESQSQRMVVEMMLLEGSSANHGGGRASEPMLERYIKCVWVHT